MEENQIDGATGDAAVCKVEDRLEEDVAAQTAWLSAHSEYIDAGIELQMADANLRKAEGSLK